MKIDGSLPIAKFAADLPGAMAVFEAFGLDYACAGDRSLDDAAHAEGIAPEVVMASLRKLQTVEGASSWSERPLVDLIRHLEIQHHHFVREELAKTALLLAETCASPLHPPPEMLSLRAAFTQLSELVLPHLRLEEENVFPTIATLERAWQNNEPFVNARGTLQADLQQLAAEHGAIAALLATMRELRLRLEDASDLPPRCASMLADLRTLEAHLHKYMFLENCILFPRAAALAEPTVVEAARPGA